ncbi:hypothetical protein DFQ28_009351 [Apophysomyces sp. BC1034]|nr:hypothetical protein DFQ30_009933 [Apophysomyces sp. BC1015]KAG0192398.1 hypothetical protein DFQ28_009351 [Apophysomyces sp. BC1034]
MDFDLNNALNSTQAATYIRDDRPKSVAAPKPPQHKLPISAITDTPDNRGTTYRDLPVELIRRIGRHVPLQDMGNFSTIERRTYQQMRERRLIWSYCQRSNKAVSLSSLNRILDEIEGALEEPAQRVEPIEALRQRLLDFPEDQQPEAFEKLFLAANRIPKEGGQIQKEMTAMLSSFPDDEQFELFDFVMEMAKRRGPDEENVWLELAGQLTCFPGGAPEYLEGYEALLAQLPHLSDARQAELIPVLSGMLYDFDEADGYPSTKISELYAILRERVLQLSPPHQGAPVGAMATAVLALPETEQPIRYAEMRNLAMSLPDEQWGIALYRLPAGFAVLPSDRYAEEFQLLESGLERVPLAQRVQAASGLLDHVHHMDDMLAERVWQRALGLLDRTEEAKLFEFLNEIKAMGVTSALSGGKRKIAINSIMAFIERNQLSEQARARVIEIVP